MFIVMRRLFSLLSQTYLKILQDGKELNKSINPDKAVACGANVQAAILLFLRSRRTWILHRHSDGVIIGMSIHQKLLWMFHQDLTSGTMSRRNLSSKLSGSRYQVFVIFSVCILTFCDVSRQEIVQEIMPVQNMLLWPKREKIWWKIMCKGTAQRFKDAWVFNPNRAAFRK